MSGLRAGIAVVLFAAAFTAIVPCRAGSTFCCDPAKRARTPTPPDMLAARHA
jgi:hypothetical protein